MLHRRFISTFAAALLAVGLLAGCGSDEGPSSNAADTSPSAKTDGPPTLPAEAKGADEDSAKVYAGFWVESLNYATTSGDTTELKKLGTNECESCVAFASTLDQIYGAGGRVQSKGWTLQNAVPIAGQPETEPALRMDVLVQPQKVTEKAGAKTKSYDGGIQTMTMFLVRRGDGWLVDRLDLAT